MSFFSGNSSFFMRENESIARRNLFKKYFMLIYASHRTPSKCSGFKMILCRIEPKFYEFPIPLPFRKRPEGVGGDFIDFSPSTFPREEEKLSRKPSQKAMAPLTRAQSLSFFTQFAKHKTFHL
jgi:hypothetical protein